MRRIVVVLIFIMGTLVGMAGRASACSCALGDPRDALARGDGAFIGTLVDRLGGPHDPTNTFRFSVELVLKGEIGSQIDVSAASSGAICGLELAEGDRVGLLLSHSRGAWSSNRCEQVDPQVLLTAAGSLPAANGSGSLRFIVVGSLGEANLLGVDGSGRTLGYGYGEEAPRFVSVCPGSDMAVGILPAPVTGLYRLAVIDLSTLRQVASTLVSNRGADIRSVVCRDQRAGDVLVLVDWWRYQGGQTSVVRVGSDGVKDILTVPATYSIGMFQGDRVDVVDLKEGKLYRGEIATGEVREQVILPAGTWVAAVSPDGAKVAGMVFDQRAEPDAPPSFVYLIDLRRGPDALPLVAGLPNGVRGLIEWIDDDRFALFPGGDSVLRTYDASLNLLGEIGNWPPGAGVLARGVVYGMRHATSTSTMLAATLPNGPVEVLGTFDSPQLAAVAFVPGAVRVNASRPAASDSQAPDVGREATAWWLILVAVALAFGSVALAAAFLRRTAR